MRSAETQTEGKLRFYYELKRHFTFEKYLDLIPRKERKAITRLRISSHTLPIEVLRYQGVTDEGDRKCDICKTMEIGDEWHYLLKCRNHNISNTRESFMQDIKTIQPQLRQFNMPELVKYCLIMQDTQIQQRTALFVKGLLDTYSKEKEQKEGTCSIM